MIEQLKEAASAVGIEAIVTNSQTEIDTQVAKMMERADAPKMAISWDINYSFAFNEYGFLKNPDVKFVVLIMGKATDQGYEAKLAKAEEMKDLFVQFVVKLREILMPFCRGENKEPIVNFGCKLAPLYGRGKHSGIVGTLDVIDEVVNAC